MEELEKIKRRYGILGNASSLDNALNTAVRVAPTDLTVLITGESGVGKEVFSQIIHKLSPRKHNNFIAINCGAIPAGTINSELFGHEKGAFTGASGDRKGYFETVNGGTIFLDEIGEMPLDTQAFLLRILESGEFFRVGSSVVQRTDVRVIAATNVNLENSIKNGKFREDLYYRLNIVPIRIPPLRERKEDLYMLFRKFSIDFSEKYRISPIVLDEKARQLLENYRWPGNIRELKNVAEQLSVLSEKRNLTGEDLIELLPQLTVRHLPVQSIGTPETSQDSFIEKEILYKLLFEMKSDLNDLKSLVLELIKSNDLSVGDSDVLMQLSSGLPRGSYYQNVNTEDEDFIEDYNGTSKGSATRTELPNINSSIIIREANTKDNEEEFGESEIVDEVLSLASMEKNFIIKALSKHGGKRKDAAEELGISERTLYRKIKDLGIVI